MLKRNNPNECNNCGIILRQLGGNISYCKDGRITHYLCCNITSCYLNICPECQYCKHHSSLHNVKDFIYVLELELENDGIRVMQRHFLLCQLESFKKCKIDMETEMNDKYKVLQKIEWNSSRSYLPNDISKLIVSYLY